MKLRRRRRRKGGYLQCLEELSWLSFYTLDSGLKPSNAMSKKKKEKGIYIFMNLNKNSTTSTQIHIYRILQSWLWRWLLFFRRCWWDHFCLCTHGGLGWGGKRSEVQRGIEEWEGMKKKKERMNEWIFWWRPVGIGIYTHLTTTATMLYTLQRKGERERERWHNIRCHFIVVAFPPTLAVKGFK